MIKRLLTGWLEWLSQPVAGDRVVVIEAIPFDPDGVIPDGATGFVTWSTAFENPDRPVGRVRFDEHQAVLADWGNVLTVWPPESPHGAATWRHFARVPRF